MQSGTARDCDVGNKGRMQKRQCHIGANMRLAFPRGSRNDADNNAHPGADHYLIADLNGATRHAKPDAGQHQAQNQGKTKSSFHDGSHLSYHRASVRNKLSHPASRMALEQMT